MPVLLTCEHARPDLPPGSHPGVSVGEPNAHVLWDPLALDLAISLALRLGAPLLAGQVSRAVVDLNRRASWPSVIPDESFGVPLAGNRDLSPADRARRIEALHAPYRRSVVAEVRRAIALGPSCRHLSVHSFTPSLDPSGRAFDVGLLYDADRPGEVALAAGIGAALSARAGLEVRHNEPYLGTDEGMTTWLRERFADPSYAGIELELNQDRLGPRLQELVGILAESL